MILAVHFDSKCLWLGLGLATQASRVNIPRMAVHTATGEASRVYSISHFDLTTDTTAKQHLVENSKLEMPIVSQELHLWHTTIYIKIYRKDAQLSIVDNENYMTRRIDATLFTRVKVK